MDQNLIPLPPQPRGVPWPTQQWPEADLPAGVDPVQVADRLDALVGDEDSFGTTNALLIVQGGQIVAERYAPDAGPEAELLSWSIAKSITHAVLGILVRDGSLVIDDQATVPEWSDASDPRRAITVENLLRMSSGLAFVEDYIDDQVSDVIEMLFGAGADDVASFAASFPLVADPGTRYYYSSGTTNILARIAGDIVGGGQDGFETFVRNELFGPIGMSSAKPRFDAAGTFVGSSYVYATARDFARFATLYLRAGTWDGRVLLDRSWVDDARTPTTEFVPPGEQRRYGSHWWLWDDPYGTFAAHGYQGQRVAAVPALDLIVVRLGVSQADQYEPLQRELAGLVECFAGVVR